MIYKMKLAFFLFRINIKLANQNAFQLYKQYKYTKQNKIL
jgi:hypothetical protein